MNHSGPEINICFVLEFGELKEFQLHRWSGGGGYAGMWIFFIQRLWLAMGPVTVQPCGEQRRQEMSLIGLMRAY